MNEYEAQAREFLRDCNATMKITYLGYEQNKNWGEKNWRNTYRATIRTPRGSMWVKFWDSVYNTQHGNKPNEYDVLACLVKYDVGTIDDFVNDFGYEFTDWADVKRIQRIYKAVCAEYKKVCRCFTEEQLEAMQEIQ